MIIRTLIPVEEAEAGLSRIIEQMRQGEEIVLLKDGIEIARISSLRDQAPAEGSQALRRNLTLVTADADMVLYDVAHVRI